MRSILWQDWTTVRGSGTTSVVQASPDWLDLPGYADVVFWIEIAEVTNPGAGTVTLSLETAPAALESLFVPVDTVEALAANKTPKVRKVFLNGAGGVPLARFLRWKLGGSVSGTWDVTFRLHATFGDGVRSAFSPRSLPGLLLWLRADQGVTVSGAAVTAWRDLSGLRNDVDQAVAISQPVLTPNAIGGRAAIDFTGQKYLQNTLTSLISSAGTSYSVLVVAKNGSGSLLTLRRSSLYSTTSFYLANTYIHSDGVNPSANITVANTLSQTQSAVAPFKSCHRFRGAGVNLPQVYLNGAGPLAITGGTSQTTETGTTGFVVGNNALLDQGWNGLISEIILTSGQISDADRLRVEAYQKDFFGV